MGSPLGREVAALASLSAGQTGFHGVPRVWLCGGAASLPMGERQLHRSVSSPLRVVRACLGRANTELWQKVQNALGSCQSEVPLMIQSAFNSLNEALWKDRVQLVGAPWSVLSRCLLLGFVRML